jgi:hypothetical protein
VNKYVHVHAQSSLSISTFHHQSVNNGASRWCHISLVSRQQCFSAGARIFLHRFPLILHMWAKYESAGRTCRATEWKLLGQLEHCWENKNSPEYHNCALLGYIYAVLIQLSFSHHFTLIWSQRSVICCNELQLEIEKSHRQPFEAKASLFQ